MIHKMLFLALFSILFFSCSKTAETDYQTNYTIQLDQIDSEIPIDSVVVEIWIDGIMDTTYRFLPSDLDGRSVHVPGIQTEEGSHLEIRYEVYSDSTLVASGSDEYDPEDAPGEPTTLGIHSSAIDAILQRGSSNGNTSSEESPISSETPSSETILSSTTTSSTSTGTSSATTTYSLEDFSVQFTADTSFAKEGVAQSSPLYPHVYLELLGPTGATLPENFVPSFFYAGTAQKAVDFNQASLSFAKNSPVGQQLRLVLSTPSDKLVEGTEQITITIENPGTFGSPRSVHTVSLLDADSAWVEFQSASDSILESAGAYTKNLVLKTSPVDATLSESAVVRIVRESTSTAVAGDDYTGLNSGDIIFPANSGNNTPQPINLSAVDNVYWNDTYKLNLALSYQSGSIGVSNDLFTLSLGNDDYEYLAILVQKGSNLFSLAYFDGGLNFVKEVQVNYALQTKPGAMFLDGAGHLDIIDVAAGDILFWNNAAWSAVRWKDGETVPAARDIVVSTDASKYFRVQKSTPTIWSGAFGTYNATLTASDFSTISMPPISFLSWVQDDSKTVIMTTIPAAGQWGVRKDSLYNNSTYHYTRSVKAGSGIVGGLLVFPGTTPNTQSFGTADDEAWYLVGKNLGKIAINNGSNIDQSIELQGLGSSFSEGKGIALNKRGSLIVLSPDSLYEVNPATGDRIRAKPFTMGTILDFEYITHLNTPNPTP